METFDLGRFKIDIVDSPLKTLPKDRQEALIRQCIPVARLAFGNDSVTETDIIKHALEPAIAVFVRDARNKVVAFTSCVLEKVDTQPIVYLEGTAILPEHQHAGLYGMLIGIRILYAADLQPAEDAMLSTRTQSPLVLRKMAKKYQLYPRIGEPTPEAIGRLAESFARIVRESYSDFQSKEGLDFDRQSLVMRRAYGLVDPETGEQRGFCMYGDKIPWCDVEGGREIDRGLHQEINDFFRDHIDLENGDTVLLMGPINLDSARDDVKASLRTIGADSAGATALKNRFHLET